MDKEELLLKFKNEAEKRLIIITDKIKAAEQVKNIKERIRKIKTEELKNFNWLLNMSNEELFNMLEALNIKFDENSIIMFKYVLNSKEIFQKSNSNRLVEATKEFQKISNELRRISMTNLKSQELMVLKKEEELLKDLIPKIKKNYIEGSFTSIMVYRSLFDSFYELTDEEIFDILQLMVNSDLTVIKRKAEKDFEIYNDKINEELNIQEEPEILDQGTTLDSDEKPETISEDYDDVSEETPSPYQSNNEPVNYQSQNDDIATEKNVKEDLADYEKILGTENFNLIKEIELSAINIMSNDMLYNMSQKNSDFISNILALYKNNKISVSDVKLSMYDSSLYLNFLVDAINSNIKEIHEYMDTYTSKEEAILAKEEIMYYLNKSKELYENLKKEILLRKETVSITPKNTPMRILYYGNGSSELTEFEKSLKEISPEHFPILYDTITKLENGNFNKGISRNGIFSKINQDLYVLYKILLNNHVLIFSCGYMKDLSVKNRDKETTLYSKVDLSDIEEHIRNEDFEYKKMYDNSSVITKKMEEKTMKQKSKDSL